MTASISVQFKSELTVTETFAGADAGNPDITISSLNEDGAYTGSSSVPVTKAVRYDVPLSSGALTIDLTTLVGLTADETVNGTNLKAQFIKLKNKSTNANKMIFSNGASNPYRIDGLTTAWSIPLAPGQSVLLSLNEAADDVASGHKTIDVAGTLAQTVQLEIILG